MLQMQTGKLAGKTLFITGASRGIGKAIALKAARDGANIVIAAKTTEPHPKLPGTIYTAAKEVEEVGGKCLPCAVDIRDEGAVTKAVQEAVKTFGGIDILVNNASAISLTGTLETPMKRYDLMNDINVRGTFLCSQACLPYLKKAKNPHILNIAPPLNIRHAWFKDHIAYSLSKYGMTLCVLGMSQEFKDDGIAVNALWPKTGIATVAVMVTAGKEGLAYCRTDRVFADAAYVVLTRDSRARTGEFLYDEDVLRESGVTDFEQYSYIPAGGSLPDGFVEGYSPEVRATSTETTETTSPRVPLKGVQEVIEAMKSLCNKELVQGVKGVFEFHLTGKEPGIWHLDLKNNAGAVSSGSFQGGEVDSTMTVDSEDFVRLFMGQLNPAQAYLRGQIQIQGSQARFMKLEKQLMEKMKSKL